MNDDDDDEEEGQTSKAGKQSTEQRLSRCSGVFLDHLLLKGKSSSEIVPLFLFSTLHLLHVWSVEHT